MSKKVIFIDTVHPVLQDEFERYGWECYDYTRQSKEEIEKDIASFQGLVIRSRFKIDKEFIDKALNLKFIARSGSGMENIDYSYAQQKGIKCFNAPEGNRDAVGEHAIAMLLALFNNIIRGDEEVRKQQWNREKNRGHEIKGKTVGIIGYGHTGSAFAKKLSGFECTVLAYDKYKTGFSNEFVQEASMDKIFKESDIVSIHLPLTEETHYLVNDEFLNNFQKKIYIINTARGKILKTKDLVKNLKSGKVLGACLDVLEYEKTSFENLDEVSEDLKYLFNSHKVILSPHVAGWTFESYYRLSKILADKILNEFK